MEPADPDDPGDPAVADDPAVAGGLADGDADCPAADPDEADPGGADVDGTEPDEADALGWVGGLRASCLQAAMITRPLAGSALPPTPLRSTK